MNLRKVLFISFGMVFVFSIVLAEPTITPSGSVQVTGGLNNGKSSFQSETNLNLEINFSDNVSGYIQATNDFSNDQSSAKIHQAYVVLAEAKSSQEKQTETTKSASTNNKQITDKELTKIVQTAAAKLFTVSQEGALAKTSNNQEITKPNPSSTQIQLVQLASSEK